MFIRFIFQVQNRHDEFSFLRKNKSLYINFWVQHEIFNGFQNGACVVIDFVFKHQKPIRFLKKKRSEFVLEKKSDFILRKNLILFLSTWNQNNWIARKKYYLRNYLKRSLSLKNIKDCIIWNDSSMNHILKP